MDQSTRNTLRNVVTQCRKLLEESVAQVLQGQFGIYAAGKNEVQIEPEARMSHLSEEDRAYRQDLLDHYEHIKALGYKAKDALAQLIREVAFTHLNRFCAYRMMESRGLIRESVSKGLKSQGFLFYLADHEEDERRFNTGQQDVAYRHFLNWLGGTLSEEIGVLFAPTDPANRLYPPQRVIDQVLGLLNDPELVGIWSEDEAIGWVYQYFTPKELRDQARKESQAPRNSYELAFRNQFFTPRYVVEFLTDNTLGRIWYEMRQGNTRLKDQCRYMVRRPSEVFLKDGEAEPKDAAKATDDLSQEELLKLPVYVSFRAKKDPRELRILDPACGSGHFLLYCFDLLLTIYEEAYGDPDLGPALKKGYPTLEALRREMPRLILAHNLHGIDIDPRASQIAALALWLRCQRAYQEMGVTQHRPKITRSNIVCAEPMPGEQTMLKEFVDQLEPKVLGQVVEVVFDKMKLAGDAGSLLRIEEDIREAVAAAKKQYARETTHAIDRKGRSLLFSEAEMGRLVNGSTQESLFDISDVTDAAFFEQAEKRAADALKSYAEQAQARQRLSRSLFSEDVVRGFAFVESCQRHYDVVLMNPPFGDTSPSLSTLAEQQYGEVKRDIYAMFIDRAIQLRTATGVIGAILPRTGLFIGTMEPFRRRLLDERSPLLLLADLGKDVLDEATVRTACYCLGAQHSSTAVALRVGNIEARPQRLLELTQSPQAHPDDVFIRLRTYFRSLPGSAIAYWIPQRLASHLSTLPRLAEVADVKQGIATGDNFRFLRLLCEVPVGDKNYRLYSKGGEPREYYGDIDLYVYWENDGQAIKERAAQEYGSASRTVKNEETFGKQGITYSQVNDARLKFRIHPRHAIYDMKGPVVFPLSAEIYWALLGVLNSSAVEDMMRMATDGRQWHPTALKAIPFPELDPELASQVGALALAASKQQRSALAFDEAGHFFGGPRHVNCFTPEELEEVQRSIDELVWKAYGAEASDIASLRRQSQLFLERIFESTAKRHWDARDYIHFAAGIVLGRWQGSRRSEKEPPLEFNGDLTDFPKQPPAARMSCSPEAKDHSHTGPEHCTSGDSGIATDEKSHPDDIVSQVRNVCASVWGERAEELERNTCELSGVKDLRDYFRKPGSGGFWDDHVARYTKSRRKAPIYWLLQSSKKNYAIWLYYHRLDKDILFKALVNYVEPKISLETDRLDSLRSQKGEGGTSKATKKFDKEIEKQEDFLSELRDFEEKLRRAAELRLVPDLNDGVVLNIAPLHELVPWKEAEKYWEELLEGKYEWSSIGKQLREKGLVK